jgi:transposase
MLAEFAVLRRSWTVERTGAELMRNRRLAKDWEGLPATTGVWIELAMSRQTTKKLARSVI